MGIRLATLSDIKELSTFAEETFRDTFSDSNSADNMDIYCRLNFSEKRQIEEINNSNYVTLVYEKNAQLIAYSQLRWLDYPKYLSGSRPGEILRFYVDKKWHGKKISHELMSTSLEILKKHNKNSAWLGVWEHNPRGISFYKKFNFKEVGQYTFKLGKDPQTDIIMEFNFTHHDSES